LESIAPIALSKEDSAKYRPRIIGFPAPLGRDTFEFAIYGDNAPSSMVRLTDLFLEHGARLLKHRWDWNDEEKRFAAFYLADMTGADCSSSRLAEILRSKSEVDSVQVIPRTGALFGYSTFPIILNGLNRGVILRIENWFQMEDELVKWMGTAGESIMFREGESYGISTCRRYADIIPPEDHALLFQNLRDGGKATGWGIMDYRISEDRSLVFLEVKYPVTNSKGEVTSRFFLGMLCGVLEILLKAKLGVQESVYDRTSATLRIKYKVDWQRPPP